MDRAAFFFDVLALAGIELAQEFIERRKFFVLPVKLLADPLQETADVDIENNYYPRRIIPSRIESFKSQGGGGLISRDIMQDIKTELSSDDEDDDASDDE